MLFCKIYFLVLWVSCAILIMQPIAESNKVDPLCLRHNTVFSVILSKCSLENIPKILIKWPTNHFLLYNEEVTIKFKLYSFDVPRDGYIVFWGEKLHYVHNTSSRSIKLGYLEPGTHFIMARLYSSKKPLGEIEVLHIESIVTKNYLNSRRRPLSVIEKAPTFFFTLPRPYQTKFSIRATKVCYISSTATFDGQKRIWLDVIEKLDHLNYNFEVITFSNEDKNGIFYQKLQNANIPVQSVPLTISSNDVVKYGISSENVLEKLFIAYTKLANLSSVDSMEPLWAKATWKKLVNSISQCKSDILVYANSRNIGDKMISIAARIAGVPKTVFELPNIKPVNVFVDAVVGPSHFSVYHNSITNNANYKYRYVINPGVDTIKFFPRITSNDSSKIIGYVGRLGSEKSIGLLLWAAKNILKSHAHTRFVIIGDGELKENYQNLVREWNIESQVEFKGAIYSGLASYFREFDIFVCPSLRDETETFCISNIEAMASGLPIIGFGVGGTMEYLEHNVNSLLVDEATPEALTRTILILLNNPSKALELGEKGRKLVESKFQVDFMAQKYDELFKRLHLSSRLGHP